MSLMKFLGAGLALALAAAPVEASPVIISSQTHLSDVIQSQWHGRGWSYRGWGYRGGYYGGYRRGWGWGSPWPFIGFGAIERFALFAEDRSNVEKLICRIEKLSRGRDTAPPESADDPREEAQA